MRGRFEIDLDESRVRERHKEMIKSSGDIQRKKTMSGRKGLTEGTVGEQKQTRVKMETVKKITRCTEDGNGKK